MNKTVENYVLLQKVGQGQYGNVYKAQHKRTQQQFAIKVMNAQKFKYIPKLTQFTNTEISILSRVNHQNIIKFVQMLQTPNNYYLVYKFCDGGTLSDYIKSKGRLDEEEAIIIFKQLRSAFEELQNNKILHRDLKPTNILIHDGVIKLADFGFCKQMVGSDLTESMVGSPLYMSPQVMKGLPYDSRADIWSLGVILYEMLYGICPYEETSVFKLINLIDSSQLKFPKQIQVSDHLKQLMRKMLALKLKDRITASQLISYPLTIDSQVTNGYTNISSVSIKQAVGLIRRSLFYLAQTLNILSDYANDLTYLRITFMVFKMLCSVQNDTARKSKYWDILQIDNSQEKWDNFNRSQSQTLKPFGQIIKKALSQADKSDKTKKQLQTEKVNGQYFLQQISIIKEKTLKERLINCFLFIRHFSYVMNGKQPDFTDYSNSNKTVLEKQMFCLRFIKGI